MRFSLICLALMGLPGIADAGAWARDKGETFISNSYLIAAPPGDITAGIETYGSLYLEHGLGHGLTIGLDAGMDQLNRYTAFAFLRRSVGAAGAAQKFAVQAGLGTTTGGGAAEYLLQLGASWGHGLKTRFGPGWIAVDASLLYHPERRDYAAKTDITLGVATSERTKWILQVQLGDYPGSDPYLRLSPSLARRIGERTHIEIGAQIGVVGDNRVGLTLGTWLEF